MPVVQPSTCENDPFAQGPKRKASHVGAPAVFLLQQACQHLVAAFDRGVSGCYLVGSALERPDWRDVDVRFILGDPEFEALFPDAILTSAAWEHDPRWLLLTTCISAWLRSVTGLPIDFQFQPMTWANEHHPGMRSSLGHRMIPRSQVEATT